MRIIKNKSIFIILIIFILSLTMIFSGLLIDHFSKPDIKEVLKTEEYSYLPEEAKDYVEKVFEETGQVVLTEKNKKENVIYLNPKYIKYLQLSSEEKKEVENIPDVYTIDYNYSLLEKEGIFPSTYDLRDDGGYNYITPMQDQGNLGLCWAFTSAEQVESLLMKRSGTSYNANTPKFSVRQMDYATSSGYAINNYDNSDNAYRPLTGGGNFFMSSVAMSNGITLTKDSKMPYDEENRQKYAEDVFNYDDDSYEVNEAIYIPAYNPSNTNSEVLESYVNLVKNYVYNYGGAYVGTESPDRSCATTNTDGTIILRIDDACIQNAGHAMQVIGWDDNYTYSYCKKGDYHSMNLDDCSSENLVTGTGAWILKNSWGTNIQQRYQYVYLAYDSLDTTYGAVTKVESMNERTWDNNYHENFISEENGYFMSSDSYKIEKKNSGTEKVDKVKFYAYAVDNDFMLNIRDGEKVYNNVGYLNVLLPGVYTFDLETSDVVIESNDVTFEVVSADPNSSLVSGSISVFTTNLDDEIWIDNQDYVLDDVFTSNENYDYEIPYYFKTVNLKSGEKVSYKLYKENVDITSSLRVVNDKINDDIPQGTVVKNDVLSNLRISKSVGSGEYKLEIYYNNNLLGTSIITLGDIIHVVGKGWEDDPYIISTEEQLQMLRKMIRCAPELDVQSSCVWYYKLANDITLTKKWIPAGDDTNFFVGGLDGDGHTIYGLDVESNDYGGLFGYTNGLVLKNINFDNPKIVANNDSGVIFGKGADIQISNVNINGGSVKSNNGNAGSVGGYVEIYNSNSFVDSVYNSSTVSGNKAAGLVGSVGQDTIFTTADCVINFTNIMNIGNIDLRKFDGNPAKSSLLIGEVNFAVLNIHNVLLTGKVLDDSSITYNSFIGSVMYNKSLFNGTIKNGYYVNGNSHFKTINGYSTNIRKKTIVELKDETLYSGWANFSSKWKIEEIDGIKRIPKLVSSNYSYMSVDDIYVGLNNTVNLFRFVDPNIESVKNINVSNIDSKYISIDEEFNIKGLKTGKTSIHISSLYDGYDRDVEVNIVENLNPVVKFYSNDGNNIVESQTTNLNEEFTLNANKFKRDGYKFIKWNTKNDGSGISYNNNEVIDGIGEDLSLYAIWEEITYKIIYNYDGDFNNVEVSVKYSDEVDVLVNDKIKDYYKFIEWNTKKDGSGISYSSGKISKLSKVDGDIVNLYAIWKLTIKFNSEYIIDDVNELIDNVDYIISAEDYKEKLGIDGDYKIEVDVGTNGYVYTGSVTKIYDGDKFVVKFINIIRGDINSDGKISALDYVKVKNHIMKTNLITDPILFKAADANSDNKISALDYVRIKNIIMKGAN